MRIICHAAIITGNDLPHTKKCDYNPHKPVGAGPEIGVAIRKRRKSLKKTLQEVAQSTDLTIGFLSQVERGLCYPSLSSFMRIADALQTSMEQLLHMPDPFSEYTSQSQRDNANDSAGCSDLQPWIAGLWNFPAVIAVTGGSVAAIRQLDHATENDLAILIAFPNYSSRTIELARIARERRAKILGVTGSPKSPLTSLADVNLFVNVEHRLLPNSAVSAISTIVSLVSAVAHERSKGVDIHMRILKKCFQRFDASYSYKMKK